MKTKLRKGDLVKVIAGKDKGKEGKVLLLDRKNNRVIVEGVNIITKHQKQSQQAHTPSGIIKKEAAISTSNVVYLHKGKATKLGYKLEETTVDGKKVISKKRFAKSTGEIID